MADELSRGSPRRSCVLSKIYGVVSVRCSAQGSVCHRTFCAKRDQSSWSTRNRTTLLKKWCLLAPFGVPIRCPKNCTPNGATWHLQIWRGTLLLLAPFGHPSGWCQVAPLLSICGTHIMAPFGLFNINS